MVSSLEQSDPGTEKRTNEWKGVVILEVDLGGDLLWISLTLEQKKRTNEWKGVVISEVDLGGGGWRVCGIFFGAV